MNRFEELCKLASHETWCWNLSCSTCGQMAFRCAFIEFALGISPTNPDWVVYYQTGRSSDHHGAVPTKFTDEQKCKVINICRQSNLTLIAMECKFPDWLGYLGLILELMYSNDPEYTELSNAWAQQLSKLVPEETPV